MHCLVGALYFLTTWLAMAGAAATTVVPQYRVFDLVLSNTNTSVRKPTATVYSVACDSPSGDHIIHDSRQRTLSHLPQACAHQCPTRVGSQLYPLR